MMAMSILSRATQRLNTIGRRCTIPRPRECLSSLGEVEGNEPEQYRNSLLHFSQLQTPKVLTIVVAQVHAAEPEPLVQGTASVQKLMHLQHRLVACETRSSIHAANTLLCRDTVHERENPRSPC